jgi:hypothetical protein
LKIPPSPQIEEKKIKNKTSMAKDMGPFRDSQVHSWLSEPWTVVPAEPPSHMPYKKYREPQIG